MHRELRDLMGTVPDTIRRNRILAITAPATLIV
jgi:hypothetical protein